MKKAFIFCLFLIGGFQLCSAQDGGGMAVRNSYIIETFDPSTGRTTIHSFQRSKPTDLSFTPSYSAPTRNSQPINDSQIIHYGTTLFERSTSLYLYGGTGHDEFLGCLNCPDIDPSSVFNKIGEYGNTYSLVSTANLSGMYGSLTSDYSPWSPYAIYPPVIVDKEGKFYGYFTIRQDLVHVTTLPFAMELLDEMRR